jgi:hypothetical protein
LAEQLGALAERAAPLLALAVLLALAERAVLLELAALALAERAAVLLAAFLHKPIGPLPAEFWLECRPGF